MSTTSSVRWSVLEVSASTTDSHVLPDRRGRRAGERAGIGVRAACGMRSRGFGDVKEAELPAERAAQALFADLFDEVAAAEDFAGDCEIFIDDAEGLFEPLRAAAERHKADIFRETLSGDVVGPSGEHH